MESKAFYIENKIQEKIFPLIKEIGFEKKSSEYTNLIYQKGDYRYIYNHHSFNNLYHELFIEVLLYHTKGVFLPYKRYNYLQIKTNVSELIEIDKNIVIFVQELKNLFPTEIRRLKIKKLLC